jgi:hypothetical protein
LWKHRRMDSRQGAKAQSSASDLAMLRGRFRQLFLAGDE